MTNNRWFLGKNFLAKAITARPGLAVALLLTIVGAATTAKAFPLLSPINIIVLTNVNLNNTNFFRDIDPAIRIGGAGYFVVRDPASGLFNATRLGAFSLDENGYLVTSAGKRMQGYDDPTLTVVGDLQISSAALDLTNNSGPRFTYYEIQTNGAIVANFSDNSSNLCGVILLQNFQNAAALTAQGWRCFGWSSSAGPLPQLALPGAAGTGWLVIGALEQLEPKLQLSRYAGPPQSFSQGVLVFTSVPSEIGIEGGGFFVVRRTNDNTLFATRAGGFYLDGSGYLVHYSGLRLQGYTNAALTAIGDLQLDAEGSPSSSDPGSYVAGFSIDRDGVITEYLSDGTYFVRGQVLLQGCANPNLIAHTNFDLYPLVANSGLWSPLAAPLTGNLGWLVYGTVELSQFDTNLLAVRSHLNFFAQGSLTGTGVPSNLGLMGPGFFTVRDPVSNTLYATLWGGFQLDAFGHLVTTNGLRVQGFTNGLDAQIGDITIDTAGAPDPSLPLASYSIGTLGEIFVTLSDGSAFRRGQVLLQDYRNLQALRPAGNGLYSNLTAAVPIFTNGVPLLLQNNIVPMAVEKPATPPALQLPSPSGFRLFISALTDGVVESSTDLLHWNVIGQVNGSPDLNVAEFFDTPQTTQTFYRVVASGYYLP